MRIHDRVLTEAIRLAHIWGQAFILCNRSGSRQSESRNDSRPWWTEPGTEYRVLARLTETPTGIDIISEW